MESGFNKRLDLICKMITPCNCIADIGTDHGYLVARVVMDQIAKKGIAADINTAPLATAINHIKEHRLESQIATVCTDGLSGIEQVDGVVVAGMGGELIWKIISSWQYSKNTDTTYYLQPMTKAEYLRESLAQNGYSIIEEQCCISMGKAYSVMKVKYTGENITLDVIYKYLGKIKKPFSAEDTAYINTVLAQLEKKVNGRKSARDSGDLAVWEDVYNSIKNYAQA